MNNFIKSWSVKKKLTKIIVTIIIVIGIIFLIQAFYFTDKHLLKADLQLSSLPGSLSNLKCESWGLTDILNSCYFEINQNDFSKMLTGWTFEKGKDLKMSGKNFDRCGGPQLGDNFDVDSYFEVYPKEFIHGGNIMIFVNKENTKACVSYYIE